MVADHSGSETLKKFLIMLKLGYADTRKTA